MKFLGCLIILIIFFVCQSNSISAYALGLEVRDDQGRLIASSQENPPGRNPYEFSTLAIPILIVNITIFVIWFFHRQKKISANKIIETIYRLEISKKITFIVITSILLVYVLLSIDRIEHSVEESWGDFTGLMNGVKELKWPPSPNDFLFGFRYILLSISVHVFENVRVIPFIESICLVILTFFITTTITKKRLSGIIAVVVLMQSHLFHIYDATATYDNSWTLFYLLSLFLVYRFWYLSPIAFFLSVSSKALTSLFLPLTLFFISRSDIQQKKKINTIILYLATTLPSAIVMLVAYKSSNFYPEQFFSGFTAFTLFLRFDTLVVVLLLPLTVGLYALSKKGYHEAESIMALITGVLLSAPLLAGFTDITNQPYRFIPLIVFFAIGVGILFSNKFSLVNKKSYMSTIVFVITITTVLINIILTIFPSLLMHTYRIALGG